MFQHIEPFNGWWHLYNHELDKRSPFHGVEHSLFEYNRHIYTFEANPLWDTIESENLLVKILFADYESGYAIIELLGEWNDLQLNDFRLLREHCLDLMFECGITQFILVCENVFNAYLGPDDYYEEFFDYIEDGWLVLFRAREAVLAEFSRYGLDRYVFWSPQLEMMNWRKLKPDQLHEVVQQSINQVLK